MQWLIVIDWALHKLSLTFEITGFIHSAAKNEKKLFETIKILHQPSLL